jgi:hypothetical protein
MNSGAGILIHHTPKYLGFNNQPRQRLLHASDFLPCPCRPDSLSPGPSTRAQSPVQPDWHARDDMGAAVSSLGGAAGLLDKPPEQADTDTDGGGKSDGNELESLLSFKSGLDVLGSKHSDLQKSIMHRQHSMSANSLSMI